MKFNVLYIVSGVALIASGPLRAQDSGAADAAGDNDGRITVLDQTVPVADPDPVLDARPETLPPETTNREQLHAEFERFQQLRNAGAYDEAENSAKRIIEMAIELSGPRSTDMAKALTNLAVVQHYQRDFESALQNFSTAVDIITENEDNLSQNLINPLKGLGAAQLESGRPDLARGTYGQAVHLTHVNYGPHNLEQVDILEALAETNLRMGDLDDAKDTQDMIYSLNLRYFSDNAIAMVPSLMRRAKWQRRTGHILDERATYRRVIRIVEDHNGKDDIDLVDPLISLGESYFYIDTSDAASFQNSSIATGEMYFKRAVRIAKEHPDSDWQILAETKIALGDYYNIRGEHGRARRTYRDAWNLMSTDDDRLELRRTLLESVTPLNADPLPVYTAGATRTDRLVGDPGLREGRIVVSYDVSALGRVSNLKIVEQNPEDFDDMRSFVVREIRTRMYRPRFVDASPDATPGQLLSHTFYYRQDELDKMRAAEVAEDDG